MQMVTAAARRSPKVGDVLTVKTGGLPIHGVLGEVVEAAHGRYVPRLNRCGGIAIVKIIKSGVCMTRSGKTLS